MQPLLCAGLSTHVDVQENCGDPPVSGSDEVPAVQRDERPGARRHRLPTRTAISPKQIARFTALLWAIGAAITLAALFLPHGSGVNISGWIGLGAFAAVVSVTELLIGERLPAWPNYVTQVLSLVAISVGVVFAHHSPMAFAICSLYLFPTIFAASNYPSRLLVLYLLVQSGVSAGVLLTSGVPGAVAGWLAMAGTTATVGLVVHVQQDALKVAATTDPLTGLANRRAFEPVLARELARCDRLGHPLCVAVLDLDRFKEVNDVLGHHEGDRVLAETSRAWTTALRPFDVLARAGGDEFVLMLPSTASGQAVEILGRLARASSQDFSAGLAEAGPGSRVEDMLRRADDACYEAKRGGRGQVALSTQKSEGDARS